LQVDNIPFRSGVPELREIFDAYGEVGDIYIPKDARTSEPRGFAFVRYTREKDADRAIEALDGKPFNGRELRIQFAKQRRPENPRQFYTRHRYICLRARSGDRRHRSRSRDRDRDYRRDDRDSRRDRDRSRDRDRRGSSRERDDRRDHDRDRER
ncbi:unnamed protein product, partial [Phaeothamnion confervicola]